MPTSPKLGFELLVQGQSGAEAWHNLSVVWLEWAALPKVLDRGLSAPPGSPSDGDAYLLPAVPTGTWAGHGGEIALYYGGWNFAAPKDAMQVFVDDEQLWIAYDETASDWYLFGVSEEAWPSTATWTGVKSGSSFQVRKRISGAGPNGITAPLGAPTFANYAHGINSDVAGSIVWTLPFKVAATAINSSGSSGLFIPSWYNGLTWSVLVYGNTNVSVGAVAIDLSLYTCFFDIECYVSAL